MNGVHDMGGMHGMGPIEREHNEPVFHAWWEGRVYAMSRAMRAWGRWNLDADRYAIESIPAADYLRMSYYERWFVRLVELIVKHGFATREEIAAGKPVAGTVKTKPALTAAMSDRFLNRGIASSKEPGVPARFTVGQEVRARNINPITHTRVPRYVRGRSGQILQDFGVYNFPDTDAHGLGPKRQHLYSVRFTAQELWGAGAPPNDSVYVALWDDYLEQI